MLLTPGVKISRSGTEERIAGLTKTAISVNTPHHGTPLANHFVTIQGQTLLLVVSALATQRRLDHGLGFKVAPGINEGIVPTLSQLHGRVLHVVRADHLDVVGHYTLAGGSSGNWLPSGANFTREAFDATWEAVARVIAKK